MSLGTVDVGLLVLIVFVGFSVEAALGFGAAVVTLTGASFLMPTRELLASLVPLNLVLSASILFQSMRHLDARRVFVRFCVPALVGLPIGYLALSHVGDRAGKIVFGAFVSLLATAELWAHARATPAKPLGPVARLGMLVGAGIVHGAFATGGPLMVYVAGRELPDKETFRASLSLVWIVLNVLLYLGYVHEGLVTIASFRLAAWLVPGVVGGAIAGTWLFGRFSPSAFKRLVFLLLAVSGGVIVLRAALGAR